VPDLAAPDRPFRPGCVSTRDRPPRRVRDHLGQRRPRDFQLRRRTHLVPYRLGQQAFKALALNACQRQCAITGTHIPGSPVAHVRLVTEGGEHGLDNGPLLRSDVHTMFDRGYLCVDPSTGSW
jgi:putative restriction endonuclease